MITILRDLAFFPLHNPTAHTHMLVFGFLLFTLSWDRQSRYGTTQSHEGLGNVFLPTPFFIPSCLSLYYNRKQIDVQRISKQVNKMRVISSHTAIVDRPDPPYKVPTPSHKLGYFLLRCRPTPPPPSHLSLSPSSLRGIERKNSFKIKSRKH